MFFDSPFLIIIHYTKHIKKLNYCALLGKASIKKTSISFGHVLEPPHAPLPPVTENPVLANTFTKKKKIPTTCILDTYQNGLKNITSHNCAIKYVIA